MSTILALMYQQTQVKSKTVQLLVKPLESQALALRAPLTRLLKAVAYFTSDPKEIRTKAYPTYIFLVVHFELVFSSMGSKANNNAAEMATKAKIYIFLTVVFMLPTITGESDTSFI
jgi:hypothetical protein